MSDVALAAIGGFGFGVAVTVLFQWFCIIRPLMRAMESKEGKR